MDNIPTTLLDRLRGGDPTAMAEYLELKKPQLLAFIDRNLSDGLKRKIEPVDIFQETSLACVKAVAEMDFAEGDPFHWLCQMAERRIIDAHRRYFAAQKRSADREVGLHSPSDSGRRGLVDVLVASITSPSQAFSRDQKEFRVQAAIRELPDEQQAALKMRYVDDLPTKEIAEQMGKTDVAVRVMLSRSVKRLQQVLGEVG